MLLYDPAKVADVRMSDGFSKWMDKHYPNDEILINRKDLAFENNGKWDGFLVHPFGFKGVFISTITFSTVPSMYAKCQETKEPNPYYKTERVTKVSHMQGMFGNWSYENAVNNARIKMWEINDGPVFVDGDRQVPPMDKEEVEQFEAKPRKWGERQPGTGIIVHKDKVYVEIRPLKVLETHYFLDGNKIKKSEIERFLNEREWSGQAEHQGVSEEKVIHPRDYNIDTIKSFNFYKRSFKVV